MASQRLLRLPEVKRRTGLSRSSIYGQISNGTFPHSVSIGARAVAWVEDEVEEWINQRIDDRRRAA
jgi:prophage regulatory protein